MEERERLVKVRKAQKKRKPDFYRKDSFKKSKLGKRRNKKLTWRHPIGRHSKVREKEKSYPKQPSVGYRSPKQVRSTLNGFNVIYISNVKQLTKITKDQIPVILHIGAKNKLEIAKKAQELGIKIYNLNSEKAIKNIEEKFSERKKIKQDKIKKKQERIEKEKAKTEKKKKTDSESKEKIESKEKETNQQKEEKEKILSQKPEEKGPRKNLDLNQTGD
ncbi:hypothetical protein J4465_01795 [Candidatus Pacearchaeota archaeon]|nr:hypothetical protein [Candidatus Pacearchaeota archaeon]